VPRSARPAMPKQKRSHAVVSQLPVLSSQQKPIPYAVRTPAKFVLETEN
jgi:hypothetical protein